MSYTPNELKNIKNKINEEIAATEKVIQQYKALTQPISPENAIGRVSRMDAINNKTVNEAALVKAETKFKHLNLAIANIGEIDFGVCRICKNQIPIGRILLMPQITTCVNCASSQ